MGEPGLSFSPQPPPSGGQSEGSPPMMAIDDLLDRGRDARRRRDEAASELAAVLQALEGLAGVDLLDATQKRDLARLRDRPRAKRAKRATRRRAAAPATSA